MRSHRRLAKRKIQARGHGPWLPRRSYRSPVQATAFSPTDEVCKSRKKRTHVDHYPKTTDLSPGRRTGGETGLAIYVVRRR